MFNTHPIGQSVTETTPFWTRFGAQFNARLTHTLLDKALPGPPRDHPFLVTLWSTFKARLTHTLLDKALPGPPRDHLDMHVGVRLMYV